MSKFYEIKVVGVKPETEFARVISFEIPAELKDTFRYIPGQYLTIEVEVGGQHYRRAYSICTSYLAGEPLAIGVKRVEDGMMSSFLNKHLAPGNTVRLMPPMGNFIHQPDSSLSKHYVLFGGGSGITPLMSLIKSILLGEPNSKLTLIYSNRNQHHIMFRTELEGLAAKYADRLKVELNLDEAHDGWESHSGLLSKDKLTSLIKQHVAYGDAEYFICGPSGMMAVVDTALTELNVQKERIHKEFFTAPLQNAQSTEKPAVAVSSAGVVSDKPLKLADLVVTIDGQQFEIKYEGEDSILDAALDKGLDPPYACQIGACCTCRAKVKEGKVQMMDRESLSDSEIEEGYVLTCQSKPLTARVVYTYDE